MHKEHLLLSELTDFYIKLADRKKAFSDKTKEDLIANAKSSKILCDMIHGFINEDLDMSDDDAVSERFMAIHARLSGIVDHLDELCETGLDIVRKKQSK